MERAAADVSAARPTPVRPVVPPPLTPTPETAVRPRTTPETHQEWARVAQALAEQGHEPARALQYPALRAKAREVPELAAIFRRFHAKPGAAPTVPLREALRTAAETHIRPGVTARAPAGLVEETLAAAGEQVGDKYRAKSAALGAPSALTAPERAAERQAEQVRVYGEAAGRTPEAMARTLEQDLVDLGADEAGVARQLGTMLGDFVDPTLLVAGVGAERAAMAGLQRAAARGVPLARRILRLSHTPAGAGLQRRLVARAAHGFATGAPINVATQAAIAAEEGRVPTVPEMLVAGAAGAVAGPVLEVGGAALAAPFGAGAAERAAVRAAGRQPLTERAAALLRAARAEANPERAAALETEARALYEQAHGAGTPERRAVPERRQAPRSGALERIRRRVAGAIAPEQAAEARLAQVDELTGAANKRGDRLATEQALTERGEGDRIVRFRLDMDNFKALNDTRGHAAGDQALQAVKAALERAARPEDLVTLSRVGGDEFAITLRTVEGADLTAIRDRFEQAADARLEAEGLAQAGERRVGTSIGFAEATGDVDALELDRLADAAARARKAERAVSQPRAEVSPEPQVRPAPAPVPDELLDLVPGVRQQVEQAEEIARTAGPEAGQFAGRAIRRTIEEARRRGDLSPEAADDVIDAIGARLAPLPEQAPTPEAAGLMARLEEARLRGEEPAVPERPLGTEGAEPPPPAARIAPSPGAAANRETQPFESLQLKKPLGAHSAAELESLERRVLGLRAEAQAKIDNGAVGSTQPFDYDLQVLGDEQARRAQGVALHTPAPEHLPETPAPAPVLAGRRVAGPDGAEAVVKNADGSAVRVRYRAVEADDLVTSHDPETFAHQGGYPEGIQERRYHADKVAQEEVARVAQQLDPDLVLDATARPTEGPGISTADGVMLSGNQRTMAIKRAYRAASPRAQAYRDRLLARAKDFGLDPETVKGLRRPVLTREVIDETVDMSDRGQLAELVARFNDVATKAKDPLADAATRARRLRDADDVLSHFATSIEGEETLRDYLGRPVGREFVEMLVQRHVLPRPEAARFVDRFGAVTDEGKGVIERMLYAAAIGDPEVAARAPRALLRRLEHAIPAIVQVSRRSGWDLGPTLREALDLHAEMGAQGSKSIAELLDQGALYGRHDTPDAITLADFFDRVTAKSELTEAFRTYAQASSEATRARETVDVFGYEPPTALETFRRLFGNGKSDRVAELEAHYQTAQAEQEASIAWKGGAAELTRRAAELWERAGAFARATDGQIELDFAASPATRRDWILRARQPRVWVDVRGQVLKGPADYHRFLHPFRDPGMEHLHVLILDDADAILSHTMETSGAVNYVRFNDDLAWRVAARTKRVRGSKVIVAHNHPSGDPTASAEDVVVTGALGAALEQRGVKLLGQYVIDDLTGTFIEHRGERYTKHRIELPVPKVVAPDWTHEAGGRIHITNPREAIQELRSLGTSPAAKDRFDVLYLDSQNRALVLEPHRASALETMPTWLGQRIRMHGAADVILAIDDPSNKVFEAIVRKMAKQQQAAQEPLRAAARARVRPGESIGVVEQSIWSNVTDLVNTANGRSAQQEGGALIGRYAGERDISRRSRRVFESPPDLERAADRGELAPYTPLEPGWRRHVREPLRQEDLFGKPVLGEPEQAELLPPTAGMAQAKLKAGKITAEEIARVRREGTEPPGERPRELFERGKPYRMGTPSGEEAGALQRPGDPSVDAPSRAQLVKDLAEQLEVPIRTGKIRGRALGIYKVKPEVVRVRVANDIETIAHEVGHHLQTLLFGTQAYTRKGGLSSSVLRPWRDELLPLARGVSDESSAEGLAEFVRRYLTNPEAARRRAPRFYDFLETTLRERYPEVLDLLARKREEYGLWLRATPRARVRAHISMQDNPDHGSIRDRWTRFRTNVIDDMAWVERAVKDLTEGRGPERIQDDAVLMARLTKGAEGLAAEFIEGKARDFATLGPVGPSLRDVFAPVKKRLDDFRDYAVALRATELHGRGIETGLAAGDVAAVLEELDSPLFRQTFAELQTWNGHLLGYLRDAGVLSPEAHQAILEHNKAYLPFYRVMDDIPKGAPTYASKRFGHVFSPVKRIKGSGREIIDPFESLVKNAHLYIQIAQRQQVSNALAKLSRVKGAGWWIEKVPAPMQKKAGVTAEQMLEMFERRGEGPAFLDFLREVGFMRQGEGNVLEPTSQMAEEILQVWRPGDWMGEPNVISVLEQGKRTWYQVHPELYQALMGAHTEELQTWVRWLSVPARTLRAGATLAPEFIGRNPLRDQVQAFITSDYGFKPGFDFVRGFWHMLRHTETYGQWRAAGGERASLLGLDRAALSRTFKRAVAREGIPNVVYNPLEMLRAVSAAMEDATRVGEFARAVGKEGTSKAALLRAAAASREVSVDFARHGAKTAAIRNLSAFWNARLQGYDRLFRAMKAHPARTLGRVFLGITAPSIALYYVNRDDPDYWQLPQWQRDLFWLVKIKGTWVRIPKPFELGIVFGSIPERILEWWDTKDPRRVSATLTDFALSEAKGVFLPIPQSVQPLIENLANYNLFTGRPIVPKGLEKVAPEAQVGPHTSELAAQLGRFLDVSPAMIDNLLFAWSGGLGRLGSDIATKGLRAAQGEERFGPRPAARRLVDLPGPLPTVTEQTPLVRGFVARAPGAQSEAIERFYEELARTSVAYETMKLYERTDDVASLERWEALHADEIDRYEDLRPVADDLAGLRAERNEIARDPALTAEQKAEEIRVLERQMMEFAAEAIGFQTGARGQRPTLPTRILGRVGDVLAGAGAGRVGAP